jgi:nucleoside-diphosphate-sugar epimerase
MKTTGVLITGGAGFIGSSLAEHYLQKKVPVVCVDNFCTGTRSHIDDLKKQYASASDFSFFEADVTQPWQWAKILSPDLRISHVYHLASPASPPLYQELALETMWVNSVGLKHALEFADANNARLIFASTSEVYGDPERSPQAESYWGHVNSFGVRSCYDEAKRFGEALLFTHNLKKKTKHGLVRIFNTYGPRMNPVDGRVIINFLVQAAKGQKLTVYGDGSQTRSFCYITDLIAGLVRYAEIDICEPVNLGNDKDFSILQLAEEVKKLYASKNLEIEFQPLPKDDPRQRRPDLTKAMKLLSPWSPKVDLAQGLRLMKEGLSQ